MLEGAPEKNVTYLIRISMRISSTNEAIARYLHIRLSLVIIRSADIDIPTKDLKKDTADSGKTISRT